MSDLTPEDREQLIKAKFKQYADEWVGDDNVIDGIVRKVLERSRSAQPQPRQDHQDQPTQPRSGRHSLFDEVFLGIGRS